MKAEAVLQWARRGRLSMLAIAVFAIALATRLLVAILSPGGLRGKYDYDPSVYYAAADAMLSGRVPYRDFNLVHPPLLPLVLLPFAALGRATTDHTGFVVGNLAFTVLGAVNAVLVLVLCRRLDLGRGPAVVAGLFYAVWFGSVNAEFTMRLEPLGNLFVLLGLIVLSRARTHPDRFTALGAGALFGLACSVKIWWLLPLVVILGESLVRRRLRAAAASLAGAVCAIVATCAPFAVLAGHRMYQMVVLGQTNRARLHSDIPIRIQGFAIGLSSPWSPGDSTNSNLAIATFALFAVAIVFAWRVDLARVFVVLLAVQLVALLTGPSWYPFYDDWLAIPGAVALAAGAKSIAGLSRRPVRATACALAAAVLCAVAAINLNGQHDELIGPFGPVERLVHVAQRYGGCMQSDSPMLLIEANALTRSFGSGCHDSVDVTSPRLGIDGAALKTGNGLSRIDYDRYLVRYLTSGDTLMATSIPGLRLSRKAQRALTCGGVVAQVGRYTLYRVGACSHRLAAQLPTKSAS